MVAMHHRPKSQGLVLMVGHLPFLFTCALNWMMGVPNIRLEVGRVSTAWRQLCDPQQLNCETFSQALSP